MTDRTVKPAKGLRGCIRVPGDKSVSHRAVMFASLAGGTSQVDGFLPSGDCLATVACMRALGVQIVEHSPTSLMVHGYGLRGLQRPASPLNCVRSGTTMRLLSGILAGQGFDSLLTGEEQLLLRPMGRITEPLRRMGAQIDDVDGRAPLAIRGQQLHGTDHTLSVASAQVKSALLLAGLYADGPTVVRQCGPARDHTERMLAAMGAAIDITRLDVTLVPGVSLLPLSIQVPGDFSSAAYLLVAGALVPGSHLTIKEVGVNPTRTGLLDVLRGMGAQIELENEREQGGEPVANLVVRSGTLRGTAVQGDTVVRMIDEFPILAVAATQAHGQTIVRDATELRVKETDRIATVVSELRRLGADIGPRADGFVVSGPTPLRGTTVESHDDHRLAMALSIAGLIAEGATVVQHTDCIADSFPGFEDALHSLVSG
jgi:3-phosphoshikimate 1-carboxyvinyltransferase